MAGSSRLKKGNEGISLVVRDGVQIDDAKAAVGKKIGVPGILSTGDLIFRKWLKNNGVDPASVTFVETPFPRMKDMIKAGTVDGVLAAEPVRSMITGDKTGEHPQVGILFSCIAKFTFDNLDFERGLGEGKSKDSASIQNVP